MHYLMMQLRPDELCLQKVSPNKIAIAIIWETPCNWLNMAL